ncbi:MAG: hypothetical protein SGARI_000459 [Bacillariaceae sp.]
MMGYATVASNRSAAKSAAIKGSPDMAAAREPTSSKKALLLRNLGPTDVVFGTKGNGRNEVFLQLLEEHAGRYVKSSKFEKMALIQRLIRDWKGNFFFLNPKTNELSLAREKSEQEFDSDDEESGLPSTSSKLYTSVRRMMNYVVAKNNYSYADAASTTSSTASPKRKSSDASSKSNKKRKESFDVPAAPLKKSKKAKKSPKKAASTSVAAPPATTSVARTNTLSPMPTLIQNKRVPMLITPEPSPRVQLLSPVSFQEGETQHVATNSAIAFPTTFVRSPAPAKGVLRPMSSRTVSSAELVAPRNLSEKYVGRLEDTAIAALVSLSSASWTEGEEEPVGLYF